MEQSRPGYRHLNTQACYPFTAQRGKFALFGHPPHAIPSSTTPAIANPPDNYGCWLQGLNRAGHIHMTDPRRMPISTPPSPHSGYRRSQHRPAVRNGELFRRSGHFLETARNIWVQSKLMSCKQISSLRSMSTVHHIHHLLGAFVWGRKYS